MENKADTGNLQGKIGSSVYWYFFYYNLLPKFGRLLLAIITFAPASIFSLIYVFLFSLEVTESIEIHDVIILAGVLSCMIISTWWWLHYLERKLEVYILLPIPLIKIRLKWVIYPFMLPFFGIRRFYKVLTHLFHQNQPAEENT